MRCREKAEKIVDMGIKIAEWEAEIGGMGMRKSRPNGHSLFSPTF